MVSGIACESVHTHQHPTPKNLTQNPLKPPNFQMNPINSSKTPQNTPKHPKHPKKPLGVSQIPPRKSKMDCRQNKRSMFKLQQAAEECKKILSNQSTTTSTCHVESLHEGADFSHPLSRLRLEGLAGGFVSSVVRLCREALSLAALESVDKVGWV